MEDSDISYKMFRTHLWEGVVFIKFRIVIKKELRQRNNITAKWMCNFSTSGKIIATSSLPFNAQKKVFKLLAFISHFQQCNFSSALCVCPERWKERAKTPNIKMNPPQVITFFKKPPEVQISFVSFAKISHCKIQPPSVTLALKNLLTF